MYAKASQSFGTLNRSLQIIEIPSFEQLLEREGKNFIQQHYTDLELSVKDTGERRIHYLAGRWAAKKVITNILRNECFLSYLDIEIIRLSTGQPSVTLFGQYQETATKLGIKKWLLSISHVANHAVASVVAIV